jgi:hypothetical protein
MLLSPLSICCRLATRLAAATVLVASTGCWPNADLPPAMPPTCNFNGVCEPDRGEYCGACAADCPCCNAVEQTHTGEVDAPEAALGGPDSTGAVLKPDASLVLVMGQAIPDEVGPDFELHGEVRTPSSTPIDAAGCYTGEPDSGFDVFAKTPLSAEWRRVGFWTRSLDGGTQPVTPFQFDLDCAELDEADTLRIVARGQAEAELLYVLATSCASK